MAISPETAATTRSIFSMLSRTPRRSTSTPWTLRGRRKRQPSSTRTTERRAKQEERRSPLTDSNRRPPPYHGGALPAELRGREHGTLAAVDEAFLAQLGPRLFRLAELEAHAAQHFVRFRELHLVALHDLHVVAPRIAEIEASTGEDRDAGSLERTSRRLLVVDHETEMARAVRRLRATFHQRDELIADVDERGAGHPAAQRELEDAPVEVERLVDLADLERDVVDPDKTRASHLPND